MYKFIKFFIITLVTLAGLVLFALSNQIGGYRAFVVLSGSMEPTLKVGSLVITKQIHPSELHPFDVITFIRPGGQREFITHRILSVSIKDKIPAFKTFGDNNETIDSWTVIGGSVVGKVKFSVPYLGYIMSFTKGRLGIVLLIILPSMYIISDELRTIASLIKNRKTVPNISAAIVLLIGTITILNTPGVTHALFSDTVYLSNNTYSVQIPSPTPTNTPVPTSTSTPTPTPTPSLTVTPTSTPKPTCTPIPSITVSNNGSGSTNTVNVYQNCTTNINQNSSTNVNVHIESSANSGQNSTENNTTTQISTSSSSSTVIVNTTQ